MRLSGPITWLKQRLSSKQTSPHPLIDRYCIDPWWEIVSLSLEVPFLSPFAPYFLVRDLLCSLLRVCFGCFITVQWLFVIYRIVDVCMWNILGVSWGQPMTKLVYCFSFHLDLSLSYVPSLPEDLLRNALTRLTSFFSRRSPYKI